MTEKKQTLTITNRATGSVFEALPGETILSAAQRAERNLSYSCLNGTCASCRGRVVEGQWHYPYLQPNALTEEERSEGLALFCQAVPQTDLTIVARELAALKNIRTRVLAVKVDQMDLLAPDVMRLMLKPPKKMELDYLAGQYLDFLLPDGKKRAFSIANASHQDSLIELHIRHVEGGGFTDFVFDELKVGGLLRIEAPLGTFYLRDRSERSVICVAGGTGFAPIKAIIEQMIINNDQRPAHFFWGARTEKDIYLADLAEQWQRYHKNIHFYPVLSDSPADSDWTGLRGFVHQAVTEQFTDLSDFDVYMSGPPPLIAAGRQLFEQHGLPARHLYYDSFEFAADVLAKTQGA